ncbi:histidine kinase [Wenzhouxiangella sp. XN24]|uniref:sensor histidine kinase n=1 Tax=Wenzhouxiangella sp. XN24 TaxID=2713569 RepID=UPI0013EBF3B6|nr:histidine kinase [Wenzhouxiangella sp. XN24]NGX17362.1 sensor histidine kinase [Wenzhouxiangella sp. XN24]
MGSHEPAEARRRDGLFLPDFCSARAVLAVVVLAGLVGIVLALARYEPGGRFWDNLARTSLFLLWCTLLSAAVLCVARRLFVGRGPAATSAGALTIVLVCVLVVSLGAWWTARAWQGMPALLGHADGGGLPGFVLSNLLIAFIVTGMLLRYFWVTAQWRREVEEEAHSRIRALQARIRPHFLFNSMNTIAALTRSDPARAEEAVEDLADLFRASLSDATSTMTLKEEFELSRIYQRIEQHRLGERLSVEWRIAELPLRARIPALSVQPLLENAIYHGIEQLPGGGTVVIEGRYDEPAGLVELSVENPLADPAAARNAPRAGNRIALDNLRQRFALAWGGRATIEAGAVGDRYRVVLRFPAEQAQ